MKGRAEKSVTTKRNSSHIIINILSLFIFPLHIITTIVYHLFFIVAAGSNINTDATYGLASEGKVCFWIRRCRQIIKPG